MMKWNACYIVLNGEDFLWYSIKSIYDFIKKSDGKIIIIEGSDKRAYGAAPDGNSTDGTEDIIKGFIEDSDPGFITYKKLGQVENKTVLRNAYLKLIEERPFKPDWILAIDDDECFKTEDLDALNNYLEHNPDIVHVFNPQYWFWKDFRHYCAIDELMIHQKMKAENNWNFWRDATGREIRHGEYHERFYRWMPGLQYLNHPTVSDKNGASLYHAKQYENNRIVFDGCPRYHYGYIEGYEHMMERLKYYIVRDFGIDPSEEERIMSNVMVNQYMLYMKGDELADPETGETGFEKFKRMYPHYRVVDFHGTHPDIIKRHPNYE